MIYLKTYENYSTKYKVLDIEQFDNLFKENCKVGENDIIRYVTDLFFKIKKKFNK